jgi:hypothetical protein
MAWSRQDPGARRGYELRPARADDSYHEVSDVAVTAATQDLSSEPARDDADRQKHK